LLPVTPEAFIYTIATATGGRPIIPRLKPITITFREQAIAGLPDTFGGE
jgi:hypothetical protein